jgi:histidinol phosphatase-like enzyme
MQRRQTLVLPPLPGTGIPSRGLFVSRFGALLERECERIPHSVEEAAFRPRMQELLFRASQGGWSVYLVGNVDGVANGRVSDASWQRFDESLMGHLKGQGIAVKRNYACLDHPLGKAPHDKDSVFLFPNTGCLYHATQEDGIELRQSWMVSDDVLELAAAWRASAHVAAIESQSARIEEELDVEPDIVVRGAAAALLEILAAANRA